MKNVEAVLEEINPDLYVDMVMSDENHLKRVAEKSIRAEVARRKAVEEAKSADRLNPFLCCCTAAFGLWCLMMACLVT